MLIMILLLFFASPHIPPAPDCDVGDFMSFFAIKVNRRAAVRLMFETAATGVLTGGTPIYGDGRVDQSALAAVETVYNSLLNESKVWYKLPCWKHNT